MRIKKFSATGLFCLGKVELDTENRGVLLVSGTGNGSGKSSLCNKGIVWTLFGLTPMGMAQDDVINRYGTDGCSGTIVFETDQKQSYTIVRSRNPAKLTLLGENGQDLSSRKLTETQEQINCLLGRTADIFVHSDLFGQGRHSSFFELTPTEQREFLEQLLPMQQLDVWADKAKLLHQQASGEKATLSITLEQYKATKQKLEKDVLACKTNLAAFEDRKASKLEALKKELANITHNMRFHQQQIVTLNAKKATLTMKLDESEYDEGAHKELVSRLSELSQIKAGYTVQMEGLKKSIAGLGHKECTTCNRPFDAFPQDRYDAQTLELQKIVRDMANLLTRQQVMEAELIGHEAKKRTLAQLNTECVTIASLLTAKQRETIPDSSFILAQIAEEEEHKNPFVKTLLEQEMELLNLEKDQVDSTTKLHDLGEALTHYSFWKDSFSKTLKIVMFERVCPYLTDRVNHHLSQLDNSYLKVSFQCAKPLASGEVKLEFMALASKEQGGMGYGALSGGEQQLINFATGLALSDLAATQARGGSSLLILDEPFAMLDERNSQAIVTYLNSGLKETRETILLVSNEEVLKDLIPNRITMITENGVARIKE